MARAIWNGAVVADSDDVVVVDGFTYFPRESVDQDLLVESAHTSVCGWKGRAGYYHLVVDGKENRDAAWHYPTPSTAAREVDGRIAFWRGVKIIDGDPVPDGSATQPAGGARRRPRLLDRLRQRTKATPADDAAVTPRTGDRPAGKQHGSVGDLDDSSFEAGTEGAWTIVDFWAPWCGPCRSFHPVFDEVAEATPGVKFARCDVDATPQTAATLGILSIPTLVLFDPDGNEAGRLVGVPPRKELDRLLAQAGSTTGSTT